MGIKENARLNIVSAKGGSERVTLSGGIGQGPDVECRFCRLQTYSTNTAVVRIRIDTAVTDATTGVEIPSNPLLTPYSISNMNQLYFYSTDANAIVDIEWFS